MDNDQVIAKQERGLTTLQHLNEATRLNRWIFETIKPYIKGETLEIGSGVGDISEMFVRERMPLCLSDQENEYYQALKVRFSDEPVVRAIYRIDLRHQDFQNKYADLLGKFNTVFSVNIIEHIPNDAEAIANARLLLKIRGHLIVLVPAYLALYNGLDEGFDFWRQYCRQSLKKLINKDIEIIKAQYFILVGMIGWWLANSMNKKMVPPGTQPNLYDKMVPLMRITDSNLLKQTGLSAIAIGRRK